MSAVCVRSLARSTVPSVARFGRPFVGLIEHLTAAQPGESISVNVTDTRCHAVYCIQNSTKGRQLKAIVAPKVDTLEIDHFHVQRWELPRRSANERAGGRIFEQRQAPGGSPRITCTTHGRRSDPRLAARIPLRYHMDLAIPVTS